MRLFILFVIVLFLSPITAKEETNTKKKNFLKVSATIVTGSVSDKNWEEKLFGNAYEEPYEEIPDELVEKQDDDAQIPAEQIKVTIQRKKIIKKQKPLSEEMPLPDDKSDDFDEESVDDSNQIVEEEINEKPDESLENKDPVVADEEKIKEKNEEKEPVRSEREYLTDETRKSQRKIIIKIKDRRRKRKAQ